MTSDDTGTLTSIEDDEAETRRALAERRLLHRAEQRALIERRRLFRKGGRRPLPR